jgi:hypothetical protein
MHQGRQATHKGQQGTHAAEGHPKAIDSTASDEASTVRLLPDRLSPDRSTTPSHRSPAMYQDPLRARASHAQPAVGGIAWWPDGTLHNQHPALSVPLLIITCECVQLSALRPPVAMWR